MGHFSNWVFLDDIPIGQENVLYGILERKNVFLGYKNKTLKRPINKRNKYRYFYIVWGLRIIFSGYKGLEISSDDFEKGNIPYVINKIVRHYKEIQC